MPQLGRLQPVHFLHRLILARSGLDSFVALRILLPLPLPLPLLLLLVLGNKKNRVGAPELDSAGTLALRQRKRDKMLALPLPLLLPLWLLLPLLPRKAGASHATKAFERALGFVTASGLWRGGWARHVRCFDVNVHNASWDGQAAVERHLVRP